MEENEVVIRVWKNQPVSKLSTPQQTKSKKISKSLEEIPPSLVIEKLNSERPLTLQRIKVKAKTPTDFFSSLPKLDSTVCDGCFFAAKCPYFERGSVCLAVSSVFYPENQRERGLHSFKANYREAIRRFVNDSSLLTNFQSNFDVDRIFAIVLLLNKLNKDVNNRKKRPKGYSGTKTFDVDTWGMKSEVKPDSSIEERRERLGILAINENIESRKNLKNGKSFFKFI